MNRMIEKQRVKVQQVTSIIHLRNSKRLMMIRQSLNQEGVREKEAQSSRIKRPQECDIETVRERVSQEIVKIKAGYPKNMKDKLFSLRYGSEEKINEMSFQEIFTLLKIKGEIERGIRETLYKNE